MLQEQVSDERFQDLDEYEDIIMADSREEHWMDVAKDGEGKSNIHALMWDV